MERSLSRHLAGLNRLRRSTPRAQAIVSFLAAVTVACAGMLAGGNRCLAQTDNFGNSRQMLEHLIEGSKKTIDALQQGISTGRNPMTGEPMSPESLDDWRRMQREMQAEMQRRQNRLDRLPNAPPADSGNNNRSNRGSDTRPNSNNTSRPGSSTRPMNPPTRPGSITPPRNPGSLLDNARDAARGLRNTRRPPITPTEIALEGGLYILAHEADAILAVHEATENEAEAQAIRSALDQTIRDKVAEIHADPVRSQSLNPAWSLDELQNLAVINSHQNQGALSGLLNESARTETLNALRDMSPEAVDWRKAARDEVRTQAVGLLEQVQELAGAVGSDIQTAFERQVTERVISSSDSLGSALMDAMEGAALGESGRNPATLQSGEGTTDSQVENAEKPAASAANASSGAAATTAAVLPQGGTVNLEDFVMGLNRRGNDDALVPLLAGSEPVEFRDPEPEIPMHPPLGPQTGAAGGTAVVPNIPGSAADLVGAGPSRVVETANGPVVYFGDVDPNQMRSGMNQLIANVNANAIFRTDADRSQAANLEGQLRNAEEAYRRQLERYNQMVRDQQNAEQIRLQQLRAQAAYNHWFAQQQAYRNHYQPQVPTQQSGGHQSGLIKDH